MDRADLLPLVLLSLTLGSLGDQTPVPQLHDWLRIGAGYRLRYSAGGEAVRPFRAFVELRPGVCRALWFEGLKKCPEADGFLVGAHDAVETLYGARLPDHWGRFCLDQAVDLVDARPRLAEWLLRQAIQRSVEEGITLEQLIGRTPGRGNLAERLPNRCALR